MLFKILISSLFALPSIGFFYPNFIGLIFLNFLYFLLRRIRMKFDFTFIFYLVTISKPSLCFNLCSLPQAIFVLASMAFLKFFQNQYEENMQNQEQLFQEALRNNQEVYFLTVSKLVCRCRKYCNIFKEIKYCRIKNLLNSCSIFKFI